jgi:protocatechuate 3,4-dioxygenase beta subunit
LVELVSSAGDPLPGVRVALGPHALSVGVTDEKGRLPLVLPPDGVVQLAAATPDGRRVASCVGPPGDREVIRIAVGERLSTAGQLIDATSHRPIADGLAWDLRASDAAVRTDRAGGFVVHGAAGRRLELAAGAPGYLRSDPFELQLLDDGRPGPTLALRPAAAIEGRVVDAAGNAVAGAAVELEVRENPGVMRIEIGRPTARPQTLTDSQGRFRIASVDPDQRYALNVEAEGFARAREGLGQLEPRRTHGGVRVVLLRGQTLTGRVVDEEGDGIREAIVTARTARQSGGLGMLRIVSGGAEPPQIETASGEEGQFEIRGLPAGRFDLEVRRAGFAKRTLSAIEIEDEAEPLDVGEIALSPGEMLQGIVRNRQGRALESVEVSVRESRPGMVMMLGGPLGDEREPDALTDPAGWFSLGDLSPDERFSLEFRRSGYVTGSLGGIRLPRVEPLEMVLDPASTVAGTVLDPGADPIAGARVNLRRSQTVEMGGNVMRTIMVQDEVTDHEGRFVFEDQEPGTISLSASASGYQEARLDNLEIPEGEDLEGLELPLVDGAILEGRILAPDGRPALGATVQPVGEGGEFGPHLGLDGVGADGNGYYRLEGLAPGELSVEARHADYPRVVRDVVLRDGRNALDLTFEGGQEVAGRVSDGAGGPVADALVRLAPAGRTWGGPEARSCPDGSFNLPGVPDGEYRL